MYAHHRRSSLRALTARGECCHVTNPVVPGRVQSFPIITHGAAQLGSDWPSLTPDGTAILPAVKSVSTLHVNAAVLERRTPLGPWEPRPLSGLDGKWSFPRCQAVILAAPRTRVQAPLPHRLRRALQTSEAKQWVGVGEPGPPQWEGPLPVNSSHSLGHVG